MAFKKVESGGALNFQKWDEPKTVEGRVAGFHHDTYDGKPTLGVILQLPDGARATYPVLTSISKLAEVPVGTLVQIVYSGPGKTAKGKPFKKLELFVDDAPGPEEKEAF